MTQHTITAIRTTTVIRKIAVRWTACLLLLALAAGPAAAAGGKVNVNSAGTDDLALLPRVGPSVAQRIVDFRDENGPFETVEDLMLVRGIGEKTFALLEPYVTTSGDTTLTEKVKVTRPAPAAEGARDSSDSGEAGSV